MVRLAISNSGVNFDIQRDGSTRTQFSMREFPSDGTYSIKTNNGNPTMIVEKNGSVFIFKSDRGFRGRVVFPSSHKYISIHIVVYDILYSQTSANISLIKNEY